MAKQKQLEGEGSYRGTRRYDAGVRDKIERGEVKDAARRAKEAVETEADELEKAEKKGKRGPVTKKEVPDPAIQRAENEGMLPTP